MPHKDPAANREYQRAWARRDRLARGQKPNLAGYRSPFGSRYIVAISGCWEWTAGKFATGYGNYRNGLAHRYSWEQANGPIPEGLMVLHKCDNKPCVNPDHLYVGTVQDNARDAVERGQIAHGERHWNARLTEADVLQVWRLRAEGLTQREIALRFGVKREAIRSILLGRTWRWVREAGQIELGLAS